MRLLNTTTRTVIAAMVGFIVGGMFLLFGQTTGPSWLRILLTHTGSFIIASIVMALIFQFWQLRGLLEDLSEATMSSKQLRDSKITGFSTGFYDEVKWDQFFQSSNRLDMMAAYAATWRHSNQQNLERFLSKQDAELQVVLPDPEHTVIMEEMALRFGIRVDELKEQIYGALSFFSKLDEEYAGKVVVFFIPKSLTFSFYRFNNHAVFATYRHRPGRGAIMTITAERGGNLYGWIREEWYGIIGDKNKPGIAQLVYPQK